MMTRNLLIAVILILAATLVWLILWEPPAPPGSDGNPDHQRLELTAPPRGGDFNLISASGPVGLADFRGQVVLVYFGYTWCPDICPTNLAFISAALRGLSPDEAARVRVLFVSVDPERDDPKRLAEYTAYFHANILGLTGTPEQIAAAAALYGAAYRRTEQIDSAMGYLVDHSAYTYVIDPDGHLLQMLEHATPPDAILSTIRSLLAEG